jgi:PAS domain S-box-containing protein
VQSLDDINTLHKSFQKLVEDVEGYSMILLDVNGTILTWNKGVQKIKGYTADEIIGHHIRMFYMPQDREKGLPEQLLEEARKNGIAKHIGQRVRKNGTIFWGSIEITAIKDSKGNVIGFTKLARELNEEFDIGFFWFDNDGILHTKASPVPHTKERIKEFRKMLSAASGNSKVCCVTDLRDAIFTEAGTTFSATTIPELYKAIAFITNEEIDKNTKTLMNLLPEDLPVKTFQNRTEAKKWVRQFCK